ncbi:MAG TPA: GMC family oxidoreductase [Gemmatimonadaceae bacterium]|jgi:choline dehydrogenase-like flavoprotein|nr:GMC family oxidoreductase [Gemmatimonadaceae bacterium]
MKNAEAVLTERERASLAALCNAFHPSLPTDGYDDPLLFSTSATDLGVPRAAEEAMALLPPTERAELRRLLRLLDSVLGGLVIRKFAGVTKMSLDERGKLLRALSVHRNARLRQGFQALKRLSSFLYYSVVDQQGRNRIWPAIGYAPSDQPAAGAATIRVVKYDTSTTIDCDVCVIGSGAGGGTVAGELATRGLRTVVLEAGPGDQAPQFTQRELDGVQKLYYQSGLSASRDLSVAILAGACLGGGTTVNWQTCLRTPDYIRDEWAERSKCELFSSERFTRALDQVCRRLGVSSDESEVNANNEPIRRGCDALGYSWEITERNSRGCDCSQCGYCTFGCRVGGKQSTVATFLPVMQRGRGSTIITKCRAERVLIERGKVVGVAATTRALDGVVENIEIRARLVVASAGGVETPALLERSGLSHSALGRNLYLHPTSAVAGVYSVPIASWSGPPQTIMSGHFAKVDGNFGFRLEAAPAHPGLLAMAAPWTDATSHRRLMQRSAGVSATIVLTRDATGGRVRSRRDGGVTIDYTLGRKEQSLLARGIAAAARVQIAAGADEVHTLHATGLAFKKQAKTSASEIDAFCERVGAEPIAANRCMVFSAHQMGTCRMGRERMNSVCDENGAVYGVKGLYVADASLFPASSGVNPMITVMALAKCVADRILGDRPT